LAGREGAYEKDLDRHVNVFFGLNGSGKTSLLKILDAAMSNEAGVLLTLPFISAEVHIYSETEKQVFKRTIQRDKLAAALKKSTPTEAIYYDGRYARRREPIPWITTPLEKKFSGKYQHTFLPISRMYSPANNISVHAIASGEVVDFEQMLNDSFTESVKAVWAAYMSTVQAEVRAAQSQGLANILKGVLVSNNRKDVATTLDPDIAYSNLRTFLLRQGSPHVLPSEATFKSRFESDPDLRSVVNDIDDVELKIKRAMEPRVKLQDLIGRMFSGNKSITFGEKEIEVRIGKEDAISLGQLSSGEKQVLRLLVEALKVEKSTLLIDEPELSMHVDWQRELIDSIHSLNPHSQLVIATHSPEIMAEVDDAKIYRL
jgi:predicted ATPase